MGSYPRFRRRNYFIKKWLQGRFVFGFSVLVLFGFAVNLAAVYFLIDRELEGGLYKTHLRIRATSEIVWPVLWKLGIVTVPAIVVIAALIGYYLTRGLEFPLLQFMDALKKTGEGDFAGRLDAGSGDLSEVSKGFNRTAASFEKSFREVKESTAALDRTLEGLSFLITGTDGPRDEEVSSRLEDFSTQRKRALKALSRFKV